MAKLTEYQGKELFRKHGIATPRGIIARSPQEARQGAREIGKAVVIKAQVLKGKRGKAGLIRFADNGDQAERLAEEIFNMKTENGPIPALLVEEKLEIKKEIYAGITSSGEFRSPTAIFSTEGGMEIEEVKERNPACVSYGKISISGGFPAYEAMNVIRRTESIRGPELNQYAQLLSKLYAIYRRYDCKLVEINPLAATENGLVAVDARVDVDDDAVFRHPELGIEHAEEAGSREATALEIAAGQIDHNDHRGSAHFVQIDPDGERARRLNKIPIAYHCVGTGCAITLFDEIFPLGYHPMNFCDTSGNPPSIKLYASVKIILSQPQIRGYLMQTGMAAQLLDNTARGIIKAFKELYPHTAGRPNIPCVLCFRGRSDEVAVNLFKEHGISDSPLVKVLGRDNSEKDVAEAFDRLYRKWAEEKGAN